MNTKRINPSIILFILCIPCIFFFVYFMIKPYLVVYFRFQDNDVKTIKRLIKDKDTEYIKYDKLDRSGYRFYFLLKSDPSTSSDEILEESLIIFQDILDTIKNNDLSFFGKNLEFYLGYEDSSAFHTVLTLNNYTILNSDDSEFCNGIKFVTVHELNSIRSLALKKESIECIRCDETPDILLPDLTEFNNLKTLTFYNCKNSDGSDVFSEADRIELKEHLPEIEIIIYE